MRKTILTLIPRAHACYIREVLQQAYLARLRGKKKASAETRALVETMAEIDTALQLEK